MAARKTLYLLRQPIRDSNQSLLPSVEEVDLAGTASARAAGGRVRPIASPAHAVRIAREELARQIVFFAAGFETTTAPLVGLIAQELPPNLSILLSARLTWPAVAMLLESDRPGFEALIAPGHVSAVMGPEEWQFVPEQHGLATAIAGFSAEGFLGALHAVIVQMMEGRASSRTVTRGLCALAAIRQHGHCLKARSMSSMRIGAASASSRARGLH